MFLAATMAVMLQPNMDLVAAKPSPKFNPIKVEFKQPKLGLKKLTSNNITIKKPEIEKPELKIRRDFSFQMPQLHKTAEYKRLEYLEKIELHEAKESYEKSLLPKSGYQTKAQYEAESRVKDKTKQDVNFRPVVQDKDMKYLPQPTYKLVRYNDPPGSPEISLSRKYKFDRQENLYGLISNDLAFMVYPVVHYYADRNVTTGDVYVLPLDKSLSDIQRILKANVARRWQNPILSTKKDTDVRDSFRTMVPVDFSVDMSMLVAKEKIGNGFDGIWKTNLWVYNFKTRKAVEVVEIRAAIEYYWEKVMGIEISEYRWDIYPLGFDARYKDRVLVNAYAYTGKKPKSLGVWSVDYNGENVRLESMSSQSAPVSVIGYKLVQSGVKDPELVKAEAKHLADVNKLEKKDKKLEAKAIKKAKRDKYRLKRKEIKAKYRKLKMQHVKDANSKGKPTGFD